MTQFAPTIATDFLCYYLKDLEKNFAAQSRLCDMMCEGGKFSQPEMAAIWQGVLALNHKIGSTLERIKRDGGLLFAFEGSTATHQGAAA